jgi:hypothetical protein
VFLHWRDEENEFDRSLREEIDGKQHRNRLWKSIGNSPGEAKDDLQSVDQIQRSDQ